MHAPVVDANGAAAGIDYTVQFTEALGNNNPQPVMVVASDMTLTDNDDIGGDCTVDNPVSCTINITNPSSSANEFLDIIGLPNRLTVTGRNSHSIQLQANPGATATDFEAAITSIQYNNIDENPGTTSRLIDIRCFDGVLYSTPSAITTITIQAANNPPTVDLNGLGVGGQNSTVNYTEGDVNSLLAPNLIISDPDDFMLVGATVTITEVFDANNETLSFTSTPPAGISCAPSTCMGESVTLTGSASLSNYQTFLRTLAYTNSKIPRELPNLRDRVISVRVSDANDEVIRYITIDFRTTVDRAIIDLDAPNVDYNTTFREGSTQRIRICNINTIRSADSSVTTLSAVVVRIRDRLLELEERLFIENVPLTVSVEQNFALKTISFGSDATIEQYITAIQSIQYITEAEEPACEVRYVDVESFPGGGVPNTIATARITIEFINDHAPVFANVPYQTSILEDAEISASVFNFSASDADSCEDGLFSFDLVDDAGGTFEINATTGLLTLAESLDCENQAMYTVTARATDFGTNPSPLSTNQTLEILVGDVNEHPPVFEESLYNITFPENQPGTVLIFNITDGDCSAANQRVARLEILDDPSGLFSADASTLSLATTGLDFENQSQHTIRVMAYDAGTPSLNGTTRVIVNVGNVDDFPPVFDPSRYKFFVEEDNDIGDPIGQVFASDVDSGQNFTYADNSPDFSIDRSTGEITIDVVARLPNTPRFVFNVTATDILNNVAMAEVEVCVNDTNNNPTVLDFSANDTTTLDAEGGTPFVEESSPVPLNIDPELSDDDEIPLEISSISARITDPLDIEEFLVLSTDHPLVQGNGTTNLEVIFTPLVSDPDELISILQSVMYGNDASEPTPCSDNCTAPFDRVIEVTITDSIGQTSTALAFITFTYTDDTPVIDLNSIAFGTGHVVRYVEDGPAVNLTNDPMIIDPDSNVFTSLNISLASRDPEEYIIVAVNPAPLTLTGNGTTLIMVEGMASNDAYVAVLRGARYGSASNNPSTEDREVTFTIHDSSTVSEPSVTTVQYRTVGDIPELNLDTSQPTSNYTTTYTENGAPVPITNMAAIFDADDTNMQHLEVTISGGTENEDILIIESTVFPAATFVYPSIIINQIDSIDNYTAFVNGLQYNNTANEIANTTPRILSFQIQDASGNYSIPVYTTVMLQPVDDNDPTFTQPNVTTNITEFATPGDQVVQVTLTDEDLGREMPDSQCSLMVTPPGLGNAFIVNVSSPIITTDRVEFLVDVILNETLDREMHSSVVIRMVCTVDGRSTGITITVIILDENDNCPRLNSFPIFTVAENEPRGTPLNPPMLEVTDADVTSVLTYSISFNNGMSDIDAGLVDIDSSTGELTTLDIIDRETFPTINFTVTITDGVCEINGTFTLVVLDVNDNPPVFIPSNYTVRVIENIIPSDSIVTVTVIDDDETPTYDLEIADGPSSDSFRIDATGAISLITSLDHETRSTIILTINALDNETSDSTATVYVIVENINDERPVVGPIPFPLSVFESTGVSISVYQVIATDADPDAVLVYTFFNTSSTPFPFAINSSTGLIAVREPLDSEIERNFFTEIQITDTAGDPAYTDAHTTDTSITFYIDDTNEYSPMFSQPTYSAAVPENVPTNSEFDLSIAATDADYGRDRDGRSNGNARIEFVILEADILVTFSIHNESGIITLLQPLDRESQEYYNFTIIARDTPNNGTSRSSTASVSIQVLNINDNLPVADPDIYFADVSENVDNVVLETYVPLRQWASGKNSESVLIHFLHYLCSYPGVLLSTSN